MKDTDPPSESLSQAILGESMAHTAAEVAAEAGVTLAETRRLWRALGFPEHDTERAFTDGDLQALSTLVQSVDGGLLDFDTAVNVTRAMGQTMARLADWEVGELVHRVERVAAEDPDGPGRVELGRQLIRELETPFQELLLYVWRRHLAAAVARIEVLGDAEEGLLTSQVSIGFADIVGFTALSNEMTRDRIGDMVEIFESRCADVVAAHRGRVIKSIGDSVLFVNEDAVAAYDTAEGIIKVIGRDQRMPDVRLGLATGSVATRLGDVFGPPVNMAARLTAVARRNRIIIDQTTADLLPADQFETRRLPARPVRGFGLVEPVAVRRH